MAGGNCATGGDAITELGGSLRIDADGCWFAGEDAITHPHVLRYLSAHLVCDEAGQYLIDDGRQLVPVSVEDAPYVVLSLDARAGDPPVFDLYLSDGTTEALDPRTLYLDRHHILRCRVRQGRMPARFSRAAHEQICGALREGPSGEYYLPLGREILRLRVEDPGPARASS